MGFGRAGRAGLGWAWGLALVGALSWGGRVYGLHCTCLLHVCMMSLCSSSCVSQICICVGRGFGCAGRAGWAWDLAVPGALGWVGREVWLWWARWAGLGVCMVYIVHVFFMSSSCLCVYLHVYLRCVNDGA